MGDTGMEIEARAEDQMAKPTTGQMHSESCQSFTVFGKRTLVARAYPGEVTSKQCHSKKRMWGRSQAYAVSRTLGRKEIMCQRNSHQEGSWHQRRQEAGACNTFQSHPPERNLRVCTSEHI